MLDTGNHVIAAKGFRKPLRMRDIPWILAENDLLAGALATKLAGAASLRNLLVHGYCDIDHGVLYDAIQGRLADLEGFAAAIAAALRE